MEYVTIGRPYNQLKLSVSVVIVSQKGFNGDRKLQFFGRDYNCTERVMKNESKEIYSVVQKRHKIKAK